MAVIQVNLSFQKPWSNLSDNILLGYGTYGGGWNEGAPMTVYFCGGIVSSAFQPCELSNVETPGLRF
jgi:hypothetical protein